MAKYRYVKIGEMANGVWIVRDTVSGGIGPETIFPKCHRDNIEVRITTTNNSSNPSPKGVTGSRKKSDFTQRFSRLERLRKIRGY